MNTVPELAFCLETVFIKEYASFAKFKHTYTVICWQVNTLPTRNNNLTAL